MWYKEPIRHGKSALGIKTGRKISQVQNYVNNPIGSISLKKDLEQKALIYDRLQAALDSDNTNISELEREQIQNELSKLDSEINTLLIKDSDYDGTPDIIDCNMYDKDRQGMKEALEKTKEIAEKGIQAIEEGAEAAWRWEKEHWPQQKALAKKIALEVGEKVESAAEKIGEEAEKYGEEAKETARQSLKELEAYEKVHLPEQKKFLKDIFSPFPTKEQYAALDTGKIESQVYDDGRVRINVPKSCTVKCNPESAFKVESYESETSPYTEWHNTSVFDVLNK